MDTFASLAQSQSSTPSTSYRYVSSRARAGDKSGTRHPDDSIDCDADNGTGSSNGNGHSRASVAGGSKRRSKYCSSMLDKIDETSTHDAEDVDMTQRAFRASGNGSTAAGDIKTEHEARMKEVTCRQLVYFDANSGSLLVWHSLQAWTQMCV
jgi:hypothetical protein